MKTAREIVADHLPAVRNRPLGSRRMDLQDADMVVAALRKAGYIREAVQDVGPDPSDRSYDKTLFDSLAIKEQQDD